ncbi:flap endonuclease 1-like [Paramacrobiotus metropolitanus]|uniref:flap endonuclease 1-like n=1 Tax=Paramacrobiotus metropolitanus TaxID=2943436 RepID=UPI002445F803|nr:flap endonuclease 1-like [Paramacrobiotus metropolitanus]XP_055346727.1 flap endonuclease 1-like [Paramacrobiotus metropolitanus]
MGIKDLSKLVAEHAPGAIRESEMKNYFGRKVAIDASMALYQFMIAVRQEGDLLTNDAGEVTSHLLGLFHRTIRIIDNGIKPIWVFDGKPPELKAGVALTKRKERRDEAKEDLEEAKEVGTAEEVDKFTRRLVKITREHNDEAKKLLRLMGVPYMEAPSEAEAQCAALVKEGKVFATATEDMDALTFGSSVLLRHMTFSEAKKMPIQEIHLPKVLQGFGMTQDEFIDLCILLGCDYCESIRGIGPKKAFELIKKHSTLEEVLKNLDKKRYPVPEDWPYQQVRQLFQQPDVQSGRDLTFKWEQPDEEGLVQYLVQEKGFAEDRVRKNCQKLKKNKTGPVQGRMEDFFKVIPSEPTSSAKADKKAETAKQLANSKRKAPAGGSASKKTKGK